MENSAKHAIVIALVIISLALIYFLYIASQLNILLRIVIAIGSLVVVGIIIQRLMELKGGYGFYMMGGKRGLSTINTLSERYKLIWDVMAVWGLTLGFGLLTYPLLKGKIDKRVYAFGIISLVIIILFALPYISTGLQFIHLQQIQAAVSNSQSNPNYNILSYLSAGVTVLAGFTGSILFGLFQNTESILYSIVNFIFNPMLGASGSGLSSQIPGVAPIIPGLDVPLIAGVISLAVLLIVHEFSHGIVARSAKVKLKEIGILGFGFIPVGGYVEPDEKMVNRLDSTKQTRIFSAGIGANFLTMLVFLVLSLLLVTFVIPGAYQYKVVVTGTIPNYPANNVLKAGMQILKWNNYTINNITALNAAGSKVKPNQTVSVLTDKGLFQMRAIASPSNASRGIIGVSLGYQPVTTTAYAKIVYFLYTLFGLSMLLNFLVAVVNLLPIPGFDGWRIYKANIKSEKFVNFLGALVIICLIINILPWSFSLVK